MKVALVDVDGHSGFPNLALMKLSAWHKAQGDDVNWYAALLAKVKWSSASGNNKYIRFSCDTAGMIEPLRNAVKTLRQAGYTGEIFIYVLAQELEESLERVKKILEIDNKINPFVQPYRNLEGDGQIVDLQLKRLARWCNMASIRKSCNFENYKG